MPQKAQSEWSDNPPGAETSANTPRGVRAAPSGVPGLRGFGLGLVKGLGNQLVAPVAALTPTLDAGVRRSILGKLTPRGRAETAGLATETAGTLIPSLIADPGATAMGLAGGAVGAPLGRYLGGKLGAPERGEMLGGMLGGLAGAWRGPRATRGVRRGLQDYAVEHPAVVKIGSGAGGAGLGYALGSRMGGGMGSELGPIGGFYVGHKIGTDVVSAAERGVINDVLEGKRGLASVPKMLWPKVASSVMKMQNASGEPMEQTAILSGLRPWAESFSEERIKNEVNLPPVVDLAPEGMSVSEAVKAAKTGLPQERHMQMQQQKLLRRAKLLGTAHAAEAHTPRFVPSKRGQSSGITRAYRMFPRIPR